MTMKSLRDYGHFHIDLLTTEGTRTLVVAERDGKHIIIDDWGDMTGENDKVIGEFDNAFDAVKKSVELLTSKYKGKVLYGAGAPPSDWLDEIL